MADHMSDAWMRKHIYRRPTRPPRSLPRWIDAALGRLAWYRQWRGGAWQRHAYLGWRREDPRPPGGRARR